MAEREAIILETPEQIEAYRVLTLRGALWLESKGLRRSGGRSALAIVKSEFKFKGNRVSVLKQFDKWIEQNLRVQTRLPI